jgi:hypothetical protein
VPLGVDIRKGCLLAFCGGFACIGFSIGAGNLALRPTGAVLLCTPVRPVIRARDGDIKLAFVFTEATLLRREAYDCASFWFRHNSG